MSDDLYKMYADQYEHNARKAMQDAMGDAQAMTGGYGSTFSQLVGQQAYDETMSSMNDIALQLADRAYAKLSADLEIGKEAKVTFKYIPGSTLYAYCNKHGLWKKDVE